MALGTPKIPLNSLRDIEELKEQLKELGIAEANIVFPEPGYYDSAIKLQPSIRNITVRNDELTDDKVAIANLAQADPSNIQAIAAYILDHSNGYYKNTLRQSRYSFTYAIIAGTVGTLFILCSFVLLLLFRHSSDLAYISLIGGSVVEAIAALNLILHARSTGQTEAFHVRLDRIQRFIIANSASENLEGEIKHSTRAEAIKSLLSIPPVDNGGKENL